MASSGDLDLKIPRPTIYHEVFYNNGVPEYVPIILHGKAFKLDYVLKGDAWIPWFNTDPVENDSLAEAAAQELSHLITPDVTTVISPASSKSEWMTNLAVGIANSRRDQNNQVVMVRLLGGKDETDVVGGVHHVTYNPVTYPDKSKPKHAAILPTGAYVLGKRNPGGKGLKFIDDVYSLGETQMMAEQIVNQVLGTSFGPGGERLPSAVVMQEMVMPEDQSKLTVPQWPHRVMLSRVILNGAA